MSFVWLLLSAKLQRDRYKIEADNAQAVPYASYIRENPLYML